MYSKDYQIRIRKCQKIKNNKMKMSFSSKFEELEDDEYDEDDKINNLSLLFSQLSIQ